MNSSPETVFTEQISRYEAAIAQTESRLVRISWLRLAVFVIATILEIMSWQWGGIWWLLIIALFLLTFGIVVKWYQRVEKEKAFQTELRKINQEELDRLAHRLDGMDGGEEFADREHPYSSDLDMFGERSLFSYLSRATTAFGRKRLATFLQQAGSREEIKQRREDIEELATKLDWRQDLEAAGRVTEQTIKDPHELAGWVRQEPVLLPKPIYRWLPFILSPIFIGTIVAGFAEWIPGWIPLVWLAIHIVINRTIASYGQQVYQETESTTKALRAYASLLSRIESEPMQTAGLQALKARLSNDANSATASEEIDSLVRILSSLELRLNGLPYFIMQQLVFWDILWIRRLEAWKQRNRDHLLDWFAQIGHAEALCSLAALRFAHPDWAWPTIPEAEFVVEGENVGHPMLPRDERVANPISLQKRGLIWLITGSNMSGKSTYLRTVGINAVLALAGAPVCASRFAITPMQVLTSMRTLDSLEESTSSFYAELKRLKLVIEEVETGKPVLFLLDEILKGTNSRDRHAGARALIRQLQRMGGSGLVSTHDLELVELEGELEGDLINYSFNCEVGPNGDLKFDYTLTDGVCRSMNATELMKAMGIDM